MQSNNPQIQSGTAAIIRTYLILTSIYTLAASLIWGVNTLFLLEAGLTILQVFIVNSVFTGAMAFFEIPTGVLADTRGRRASFLLSIAILLLGTLGYVWAYFIPNNLWFFVAMSVVMGLGFTFYSGAMEAWLVDALNHADFAGNLDDVFARSSMASGVAMLIGSVAGGAIGSLHLAIPFAVRSALLLIVFVVAFRLMHDLGFQPKAVGMKQLPKEMRIVAQSSLQYGWQNKSVRIIILAGAVQSIFLAWGFYAWQPYFLDLLNQPNATWVAGVIAALISLSTIGGNLIVDKGLHWGNYRTTFLMCAAVGMTIGMVVVGLTSNFWIAVTFYLIAMGTMGVWGPVKQAYIHQMIPSEQRATVLSFDSLVGSGTSVVGQNGLGQLAQVRSFGAGYVASGVISIFVLPLLWMLRQRKDVADQIHLEVGKNSACAAHGVPAVSGLDTYAGAAAD